MAHPAKPMNGDNEHSGLIPEAGAAVTGPKDAQDKTKPDKGSSQVLQFPSSIRDRLRRPGIPLREAVETIPVPFND